jgi:protein O-GlcNAc transferase
MHAAAQEPSANLKQADAAYREGLAALNRGDLPNAESKFGAVTRLAPAVEQGHSALGAVLIREGRWNEGTRELERALQLKPGDAAAQTNLALAYVQNGQSAKALPLFASMEAAAKTQGHTLATPVLVEYAKALAAAGRLTAAVARMNEAIAGEPRNAETRDALGSLYAQQRDWAHAETQFVEAIRLKDDLAAAHFHLGYVYQAEQNPRAVDELTRAADLAPTDATVILMAGKAIADAGRDDRAAPLLEKAVALAPKSADAKYQYALVLQRVNRVREAIELLQQVVDAEPRNADALINLGMALSQAHQAQDGLPFLQRAIALRPDDATAHQDLAAAYLQINQINDAVEQLKAALKLSPDAAQLHYDLGVAYKLEDDAADAIPELEAAEKLNPSGYEPPYVLGLLYMQAGRYSEAAQQLGLSLKLHPENGEGWATLGSVYNKLDRLPDAAAALQEAIRQRPAEADSHLILATVLSKQNQPAEAAQERKVAADLMRAHMNLQRAEVATNSGKSLLASGKLDDAEAQFREALTFDPTYAEAHEELAEALDREGKTVEAASERALAKLHSAPPQ